MKRSLNILGIVAGVALVMLAFVYWSTPATLLPKFLPGYVSGDPETHVKHGIACFVLGLGAFVFVWFNSAKKKTSSEEDHA